MNRKNFTIIISMLLFMIPISNAQFGLPKIKKPKIKKIGKNKKAKKLSSNTETPNLDGSPGYGKDGSDPKYRNYSNAKNRIKALNSRFKDNDWVIRGYLQSTGEELKGIKANLSKLKELKESGKSYYKTLEKDYNTVQAHYDGVVNKENEEEALKDYLFTLEGKIKRSHKINGNFDYYFGGSDAVKEYNSIDKKEFLAKNKEYHSKPSLKNDRLDNRMSKAKAFFDVDLISHFTTIEDAMSIKLKESKEGNSWKVVPKSHIDDLNKCNEYISAIKKNVPNHSSLNLKKDIDNRISQLNKYISSGEHQKHLEKLEQEKIDKIRMGKPAMKNSSYEKIARNGIKGSKVLRVVLTDKNWYVKKNGLGIPLYKSLGVDIAVKEDSGNCYKAYGVLRRDYEGGGKYGSIYYKYGGDGRINCANIYK